MHPGLPRALLALGTGTQRRVVGDQVAFQSVARIHELIRSSFISDF